MTVSGLDCSYPESKHVCSQPEHRTHAVWVHTMPLSDCCIRMPPGRDAVQAQHALFTFLAVLILWGVMAWWVAFVLDRLLRKQYTCTLLHMASQLLNWPWCVPRSYAAWCLRDRGTLNAVSELVLKL